jgi:hypothetical protein
MKEFDPEKMWKDVQSERCDRHYSELFEKQLPVKFQLERITESKVMTIKSIHQIIIHFYPKQSEWSAIGQGRFNKYRWKFC